MTTRKAAAPRKGRSAATTLTRRVEAIEHQLAALSEHVRHLTERVARIEGLRNEVADLKVEVEQRSEL